MAAAGLGAHGPPSPVQGLPDLLLHVQAGNGVVPAVKAGGIAMVALGQAVVLGQADLGPGCEQAGLEGVKAELAGFVGGESLLGCVFPRLFPRQGSGPTEGLQAVVVAAGVEHGQAGRGKVGQGEHEVGAGGCMQVECFTKGRKPAEDPAGARHVPGETTQVHGERLALRAHLCLVASAV